MNAINWSLVAVPALLVICITGLFGLNDVRRPIRKTIGTKAGGIELGLGLSFLFAFAGSFQMLWGVLIMGAPLYTWRGVIMIWGIAGIFFLAGLYSPWKRWLRNIAEREAAKMRRSDDPDDIGILQRKGD